MRREAVPRAGSYASLLCGLAVAALGLGVMYAWATGREAWVRLHPAYMPMQFNTALAFFCSGSALILNGAGRPLGVRLFAMAATLIGAGTGFQYIFGVNLGIDEWIISHYAQERATHPGRMAPNSTIAFTLIGLALLALAGAPGRMRLYVALLFGSLTAAMGAAALFGYATAMVSTYTWGETTPMAMHTALGLTVMGSGVAWLAWMGVAAAPAQERFGFGVHVAVLAAGATVVTASALWIETYQGFGRAMFEQRSMYLRANTAVVADIIARKLAVLHETAAALAANPAVARREVFETESPAAVERLEGYLAAALDVHPAYDAVRVFTGERDGAEVAQVARIAGEPQAFEEADLVRDGRHADIVRAAMAMAPGYVHIAVIRRDTAGPGLNVVLRVATPVYVDGVSLGVLTVFADADLLLADALAIVAEDERLYLATERGEYVIHPEALGLAGGPAPSLSDITVEFPAAGALYEGEDETTVIERYDEHGRIYSAHRLGSGPYAAFVAALATDARNIHEAAVATRNRSFAAGGGLLLLAVACVFAASQSLTRPLRQIERAALAFGRGDADVAMPDYGVRETGALATAFSQMRTRIHERTEALQDEVERRKETEETLRASEERYRSLVWASAQIVLSTDAAKRIIEPQGSFERYTGLPWSAYTGDKWLEAVHPDDREALRTAWGGVKPSARTFEHEARLWHAATQSYRYVSFRAVPLFTADGAPIGWVGALDDCHEQKLAVERFRLVVESSPNGQVMANGAGEIVYVNGQAERLFGYDRGALCGMPVEALLPERFRTAHVAMRESYQTEPTVRAMGKGRDLWALRRDGSEFPVEVGLSPIEMTDGVYVLATVVDVTERLAAQRSREEYAKRLETLNNNLRLRNRELDEFTYVASHDLQEPLRKLTTFSGLLRDDLKGELPADAEEDLRVITNAARRMQTLVQDLLSLSRSGRSAMKLRTVDLGDCVRDAADALQLAFDERGAELTVGDLPEVYGDYTLLTQLFQNLLANAVKFNESAPPRVEVTAEARNGSTVIGVKDNGIGIDAAYREQIFAPFKRLHGRQAYEGTGIGLAVCRKIIERHGGSIWVEDAAPQGSHFRFTVGAPPKESDDATQ